MPYKNIYFVKLYVSLRDRVEFVEESDDRERYYYMLCVLTAGITKNKIPEDGHLIKRMWNTSDAPEEKLQETT
jgi:hypothetical protein